MDCIQDAGHSIANGQSHLPFWPAGSGHYGDTLGRLNRNIVNDSGDFVLSYIDTVPVSPGGVFTIGDYGTNDGYVSMPLMCRVIEQLRQKHGEGVPIQVVYEDQEKNDFNSLFNRLTDGSTSFMSKFKAVYPLATNVNFYKQCVPDGTCDVIFTSIATHWLEKLEMNLRDCVFDVFGTPEEQRRFRAAAARDWSKFLLLRAKELKPGGVLIDVNVCTNEDGTIISADNLLTLEKAWAQLKEENIITKEEYVRCTAALHFRCGEETRGPLEEEGSEVREAGLRLEHYDEVVVPCVYKALWRDSQSNEHEKRTEFADGLTRANRVWSHSTFLSSLSQDRSPRAKASILDQLYGKFHAMVMDTPPEDFRSDYCFSRLVARKVI